MENILSFTCSSLQISYLCIHQDVFKFKTHSKILRLRREAIFNPDLHEKGPLFSGIAVEMQNRR